jgi:starch-binding outer membrane protein, SusD/RagB family
MISYLWDNNGNKEKVEDHSAEMTAATPQTITINYILDELSREYFGEGHRWFDLVRTQTWAERAGTYEIAGAGAADHKPQTFTRDIPKDFYLRPIPQGQIDAMMMSDAEKEAYQNPGYRN